MRWGDGVAGKHDLKACGCSAQSASRSTRKPGCGITSSSAAAAARSWIPGGRPKPAIMISPLPGITTLKPGSATMPLPGIEADVVDEKATRSARAAGLFGVEETVAGDDADDLRRSRTFCANLLEPLSGNILHRRRRKRDEDGYFWLLGRVDDVMNVAGHRISTMEVESALVIIRKSPKPRSSAKRTRSKARRSVRLCR